MHIFFSGIGGAGIGPLAVVTKQAGYEVSGSDKQDSGYLDALREKNISVHIGQTEEKIAKIHEKLPIDWIVYSSAVEKENKNHPELAYASAQSIKHSKRDDLINEILLKTNQKMVAIAGTHGKTTTTAMLIWLFKKHEIPVSYSVGAKISFGDLGEFNKEAKFFIYEADEYDRNFLAFKPYMSLISGIAYDHPDIYPTQEEYNSAFREFIGKSEWTIAHQEDLEKLSITEDWHIFSPEKSILTSVNLVGEVNRLDATLAIQAFSELVKKPASEIIGSMNEFPGLSRRFEKINSNIYTDYAHTPEKILGAIKTAKEVSDNIVIVYEGLHNTRQHFIKQELKTLFSDAKKLYIVPSYLAREDENLELLTPDKLSTIIEKPNNVTPAQLDEKLAKSINEHANNGDLVLCLTAGGGGSLDEWLRTQNFDT